MGVQVLPDCSLSTGSVRCEYLFLPYYRLCTARTAMDSAYGHFLGFIYIMCFAAARSVMFTVWLSVKDCAFIFKNKILTLLCFTGQ